MIIFLIKQVSGARDDVLTRLVLSDKQSINLQIFASAFAPEANNSKIWGDFAKKQHLHVNIRCLKRLQPIVLYVWWCFQRRILRQRRHTDVSESMSVGDTQGVGGLCLPWGFHAVQTSTPGMSRNQTHWLLLNWPAGPPLAHVEPSCLKTPPLQFTLPLQLPTTVTRCLPGHGADTATQPLRTTFAQPRHRKKKTPQQLCLGRTMGASQDEVLRLLGDRCDRWVRDAAFETESSYWSEENNFLVSLVLCGSFMGGFTPQFAWWNHKLSNNREI